MFNAHSNIYTVSSFVGGTTALITGILAYFKNRKSVISQTWLLLSIGVAIWGIGYSFMLYAPNKSEALFWRKLMDSGAILIPAFHLHFILVLIDRVRERKKELLVCYLTTLLIFCLNYTNFFIRDIVPKSIFYYYPEPRIGYYLFMINFLFWATIAIYRLLQSYTQAKGFKRLQFRYMFLASFFGFAGGSTAFLLTFNINILPVGMILFTLYPLIVTYAIVRYRLMDIRLVFSKAMAFAIAVLPILAIPYIISARAKAFLVQHFGENWWYLPMTVAILLTYAAIRAYLYIDKKAKDIILKKEHDYQRKIMDLSRKLFHAQSFEELYRLVESVYSFENPGYIDCLSLYFKKPDDGLYALKVEKANGKNTNTRVLDKNSTLVNLLTQRWSVEDGYLSKRDFLLIDEIIDSIQKANSGTGVLRDTEEQLRLLNAYVVFPIWNQK